MTRRVLFQIHWFLGLTAGFVLALMGVTGAMMSFEDEIMAALSPGIVTLAPSAAPLLSPDALIAAASRAHRGDRITQLVIAADPTSAAEVTFARPKGQRRGAHLFVDPRTGVLLGPATGEAFFRTVMDLHRWLALPGGANGIGRQITGFSAVALIFFALSGLYLRWPRRALDWRAWLVLDLRKTGRNLHRALHAVVGGWVLIFYLLSALTGLTWSYDWYKSGVTYTLTGKAAAPRERRAEPTGATLPLAPAWASFVARDGGRFDRVTITPATGDKPVVMRVLPRNARFDRMTDELSFDADTGAQVKAQRYAARRMGDTIAANFYAIHTGAFFGLAGRIALFVTSLTMPLFTITGLLLYLARRRTKRALAAVAVADARPLRASGGGAGLLVLHASQTGHAKRLALLSAAAFPGATVQPLAAIDATSLRAARRALFVIATYGEGQAPDRARRFEATMLAEPADLTGLDYAVLALGDREYPDFCAFGHRVDAWLHASGARRLFDTIEVDDDDIDAERSWQTQLTAIAGAAIQPDWTPVAYAGWTLTAREHVNPGSPGAAIHRLVLRSETAATWTPGAIAEVMPRHDPARVDRWCARHGHDAAPRAPLMDRMLADDAAREALAPLAHRDYSIASLDASGDIELVVRSCTADDGGRGIASGWLTEIVPIGGIVQLRVRDNPGFAPTAAATPIVLIGNGTGIAGLIAHLRARARTGGAPAWLLYGERSRAHDRPYAAELEALATGGTLTRLDLAFSRDADCGRYVQHLVAEAADTIRVWAERGAAFYVCGSLVGMAGAVDAALRTILGDARLEAMATDGRYARDIY